jgi:hypothetical protein
VNRQFVSIGGTSRLPKSALGIYAGVPLVFDMARRSGKP